MNIGKRRTRWLAVGMLLLTLLAIGCGGSGGTGESGNLTLADVRIEPSNLGTGWKLESETVVDPATGSSTGMRTLTQMGAKKIQNQVFTSGGTRLQVNTILFAKDKDATAAAALLEEEAGGANVYGARRNIAYEVITGDAAARAAALKALGVGGKESSGAKTYSVSFGAATLKGLDYTKAQALTDNLCSPNDAQPLPGDAAIRPADYLDLFTRSGSALLSSYEVQPVPRKTVRSGDETRFYFGKDRPQVKGVPYAEVRGTVRVGSTSLDHGDGSTLSPAARKLNLEATAFWPVDDPGVQKTASEVTGSLRTDKEKVEALREWVRGHIKYGGPVGTRYGTLKVLGQGQGRCWDLSDVYVTLARAAGVPTREVAGWFADRNSGHVWAQSYIAGEGWVAVDATSDRTGAGPEYVPFYVTSDGDMPVVYTELPVIEEK